MRRQPDSGGVVRSFDMCKSVSWKVLAKVLSGVV